MLRATTEESSYNLADGWQTQLRIWTGEYKNSNEIQVNAGENKNRYTSECKTINSQAEDVKIHFFVNWEGYCTTQTFDFNRTSINNPIEDNTAPSINPSDVTMTESDGKLVFTFGEVTADDEYFYYVADKDHNLGGISLNNKVYITKPTIEDGTTYKFKCYAVDYNGNKSAYKEFTLEMPFDSEIDLAAGKSCIAGYSNGTDTPKKAVNGNEDHWGTYGISDYSKNWWRVDLGNAYNLSHIDITFATTNTYRIETSMDDANWQTILDNQPATSPVTHTGLTCAARYIRLTAIGHNMIAIRHFKVYATGVAAADATNPTLSVTCPAKTVTSATLQINAADKDDTDNDGTITSIKVSDTANGFAEQEVLSSLNGDNKVTLSGLKDNTTYNFTVTAFDLAGNSTSELIEVVLPFNTELNLALGRGDYCSAGAVQNDNVASKAVDGNLETIWTSYATGDEFTWWTVDLGVAYVVTDVKITFNDIAAPYNIYASVDNTNWIPVVEGATANNGESKDHSDLTYAAQYFKVTSTNRNFGIKEFEVYGTAFAVADATAPEVTVTEKAKTVTSVTLQIDATDADDAGDPGTINAIHISGDNDFETQSNVSLDGNNQITLSGLKDNKTYTFTVHVLDLAGNETTRNIVVELPFNTEYNIALDGTATAGYSENDAHGASMANDGDKEDANSQWNSYGVDGSEGGYANNWWQVQLDAEYNLRSVKIVSKEEHNNQYVLEGSLDGSTYYKMAEGVITAVGTDEVVVSAPARYMRFSCANAYCSIYEFEVYASGFSTLTDAKPVITYTALGEVTDVTAEIEIDAVDMTTKPITKYMVSGLGGEPVEVTATEGKIALDGLSQSTHYTASIQAKDEAGNLSEAKEVEFTTTGSASGLYLHSDLHGWDNPDERERFSTTAVSGVMSFTANFSAGTHTYKLYNADNSRCTRNDCSGTTDHNFALNVAKDVTFYATDEDHFICTEDVLYLRGTLVGEDKELEWNDAHTVATWTGTLDLSGTKQFTVVKKNQVGETLHTYDRDFYAEAQVFGGDFTFGTFTLDVTKMTGTWDYVGLSFADDAESENSTVIATYADKQANVTLNRKILADGTWYTLCLPFDMSAERVEEVFGESTIAELASAEDHGSLISLNFDYVHAIEAGKAYLIKPGHNFEAGTVIPNVQIKNVDPIVSVAKDGETDLMHFQGTYNQITLRDSNIRFVAADNYLYSPNSASGTPMGAFRCYFTIPTGSPASAPGKRARIVMGEQTATGVQNVQSNQVSYTKMLRDGQLLIIREGRMYNAQGMIVSE